MRYMKAVFIAVSIVSVIALTAVPSIAERPMRTDDPYVVGLYRWEYSAGVDVSDGEWGGVNPPDRTRVLIPLTLDYGLAENMEIGAEWDAMHFEDPGPDGAGDLTAHLKYFAFYRTAERPDIALDFRLKIPTASETKNLGSGDFDFGIHGILGWRSERWMNSLRLGGVLVGGHNNGLENRIEVGFASRYAYTPSLNLTGEIVYDSNEIVIQHSRTEAAVGIQHTFMVGSTLDLQVGFGLTDDSPDVRVRSGFRRVF